MKKEHLIDATHVSISFNKRELFSDLSFTISRGDLVALIGPNGSGKTTLVKAILGLIPYEGGIVTEPNLTMGYVPQRFSFDPTLPITITEFLNLYRTTSTRSNSELLAMVGLDGKERYGIGTLSGGELQRLLIAKALLNDPELLFLDEPVSGIDIEGAQTFYDMVVDLHSKEGKTVVLVSHEIEMVSSLATQVLCLSKSLLCQGAPKEVLTTETLNTLFGSEVGLHTHKPHSHSHD